MAETNDRELMREYADGDSEAAFAALVQRHINLVYSIALRLVRNSPDAQDVTQAVFIILAKKAASLRDRATLTGWLYETTRFTARELLRQRARQQAREQEAYMSSNPDDANPDDVWRQLEPFLEEAMSRLSEKDRALIALRFFEEKSGAETAALLGIKEFAAHKRTARALEKLRQFFAKRGVKSTTAILAGAISTHSVQAAPVALAKSVTAGVFVKGAATSTSTLTLVKGALKIMAWTKMKTGIAVGMGILLAAGTATTIVVHQTKAAAMEASDADKAWRFPDIGSDTVENLQPEVKILPTLFPAGGNLAQGSGTNSDKFVGISQPAINIVWAAYNWPQSRVIFTDGEPTNRYDFIATLSKGGREALKRELKDKLGLVGRVETKNMDVLQLEIVNPHAPGLQPPTQETYSYMHSDDFLSEHRREIKWANGPLSKMREFLESGSKWPIIGPIDDTKHYSVDFTWTEKDPLDTEHKELQAALRDQLGLALVQTNVPIEMLVVEKVK